MNIKQSTKAYEDWLRRQLDGGIMEKDLEEKHEKMRAGAFPFLRATYWRWAETIFETCPELADAPEVLAVGDIHLENYGVWRDADGRLVWGVNDFDEAAEMPYVLDLVRLSTSTALAKGGQRAGIATICSPILDGYRRGLDDPRPFVLDGAHQFLRQQFAVSDDERENFWQDIEKKRKKNKKPPKRMRRALERAMPEGVRDQQFWPKSAGTGSLGRPRWVVYGEWRGAPIIREAKAMVASAWSRLPGRRSKAVRCAEIAGGKYRAPDPWYILSRRHLVVRRLSPNSRKLELKDHRDVLLDPAMLRMMGQELANIHLGTVVRKAIIRDLEERPRGWLAASAESVAEFVRREHREWKLS
jgi:uncharacterized protein (DUF2252 family)